MEVVSVPWSRQVMDDGYFLNDELALFTKFNEFPRLSLPRVMDCVFIGLCVEGSASYMLDGERHVIEKNDVVVFSQGKVLEDYSFSSDCKMLVFMGSLSFFHDLVKGIQELTSLFLFLHNNSIAHLTPERATMYRDYFNVIVNRLTMPDHRFRREVVSSLMRALVYDMGDVIWNNETMSVERHRIRASVILSDFLHLVEANYRVQRKVSWYAEQMNISPKYLSEVVGNNSDYTPNEWIDKYVVLQLRLLLRSSKKNIKEIAEELNFPNQSFLGKYFKEHVGISPSEYRNKYRE